MQPVLADIITIGDELMIGQVVDTNSAFIAFKLTNLGITVRRIISIPDRESDIMNSLDNSICNSDIVIITGGLGSTSDDITKGTLARYFEGKLSIHQPSVDRLELFFKARGVRISDRNMKQAELPDTCVPLTNRIGTAPGMLFNKDNKLIFSLPGVPFEMNGLMMEEVLPIIVKKHNLPVKLQKTILTTGLAESLTADLLKEWEDSLSPDLSFAYLPSPGILRLRVSITGDNRDGLEEKLNSKVDKLIGILGEKHVFGFGEETLHELVGKALLKNQFTVSLAESCTGGHIAHLITSVPGSSRYYKGSVVAYANEIKYELLHVNQDDLESDGAVSRSVVEQMALGAQKLFRTTFSVATSGIAGPEGGSDKKPVGTTWIAVATPDKVICQKFLFGDNRERNIVRASVAALNFLRITINEFTKK